MSRATGVAVVLAATLATHARAQSGLCSPFDLDPTNAKVVASRMPDGTWAPDATMCCGDGIGCEERCPTCTQVSTPVDTLSGFAWLDRADVNVSQPWGPPVRFSRHYSTSAASRAAQRGLGMGWSHTYSSSLTLFGGTPAARVWLLDGEGAGEEYNFASGGAYTSLRSGRTLRWDSATQLYLAHRGDGSVFVFDSGGALRRLRGSDGGEAQLRYAGEDAACAVSAAMPAGALCRVDFVLGPQLWFGYGPSGNLAAVAHDAQFLKPVVVLSYDADGNLSRATGADGNAETYTYGFAHPSWATGLRVVVKLMLAATDADGKLVESFGYDFNHNYKTGPARVVQHRTPVGDYTFSWEYLDTDTMKVVRKTHVRSNKENLDLTFANNAVASVCYLDSDGHCDISRMHTYIPAPGSFDMLCERLGSGKYLRHERDGLGRVVAEYEGLAQCDVVTPEAKQRSEDYGYLGSTTLLASTSFVSLDATATASGFKAFTVSDYTVPGSAVDPQCGNAACQAAAAYNAGPLTSRVQQRVSAGRTLVDVNGTWGTQVQATKYTYDSSGRLIAQDGPRQDVSDVATYSWSSTTPWVLESSAAAGHGLTHYADYDELGNAHTITDEAGQTWRQDFDEKGRRVGNQAPGLSAPTVTAYLPSGRLSRRTLPTGAVDTYTYDADGVLAEQSHLASAGSTLPDSVRAYTRTFKRVAAVKESEATAAGALQSVREVGYEYDGQGRLTTRLSPGPSGGSAVGIDDDGLTTWLSDPGRFKAGGAQSHHYAYDAFGHLLEVQQLVAGAWVKAAVFTWDTRGNLATFTDAKGVTIRYQHDDFRRLVEVESPDFGLRRYVYDEADNLVKERQPDGAVIEYAYDAAGRLVTVKRADSAGPVPPVLETWTWNGTSSVGVTNCAGGQVLPAPLGAGRLTHVSDAAGDWYFGYWPDGRQRYESLVSKGASCGKTLSWEYDSAGLLTAMVYPSGARVEYGYPAVGAALHDRPSSLTLVTGGGAGGAGGTRTPLLTDIEWSAGEVAKYSTPGGGWKLLRHLDGLPRTTEGPIGGPRHQRFTDFDGWGNPGTIEETVWGSNLPNFVQTLTHNDMPALTGASGPGYPAEAYTYLASGDRKSANGAPYCYEAGTHRLALVGGQTRFGYTAAGAVQRKVSIDGAVSTWCYGPRGEVTQVVGGGGDVSEVVTNFRRQRVAEVWPVNGLREDFRVDESSRLLVEAGVASVLAQYPRPTREYVWLGMHPVAVIESTEASDGTVTPNPKGVTYTFSGQLGEVLAETNSSGTVLRQYEYTPFGQRHELPPPASEETPVSMPIVTQTVPLPTGPITMMVGRISVANPARAVKLHFTDASMVGCTVTVREASTWLGRYTNIALGDFTQWMPSTELRLEVSGCAGGGSAWAPTVGVLTDLGGFVSTAHSEASSKPYPAAGQHFTLTLAEPSYIGFDSAAVASCDKLEARDVAGQSLWQWEPGVTLFGDTPVVTDTKGFTSKLQGTVDFGIWGNGCNATEAKAGFRVTQVLSEEPLKSGPPVTMTLPGQKLRYDGTVDNWYRYYQPELGRYLSPEPLSQSPSYVASMAQSGLGVPTYAYALSSPIANHDPDGLGIRSWSKAVVLAMELYRQKIGGISKVKNHFNETEEVVKKNAKKKKKDPCGGTGGNDPPEEPTFTPEDFIELFLPDIPIIDPAILERSMELQFGNGPVGPA